MDGEISTTALRELLAGESPPAVVDIRNPSAFRRGHIRGSVNVPFRELPDRVAEFADADRVVTVCPHGKSSVRAAEFIAGHAAVGDATVESMAGGLSAWEGDIVSEFERAAADEGPEAPF